MNDLAAQLDNVCRTFTKPGGVPVRAVDGVSIEIYEGQSAGLIGESGSGKSTIGRLLLGLLKPDSGSVRVGGREVQTSNQTRLRAHRAQIGAVFQEPFESLNPRMRVSRVVEEPLAIHEAALHRKERHARVMKALSQVGLSPEFGNRYPHALSGGQQQRVGIARAIVLEPRFVVLDEPTSSLDLSTRAQILRLLQDLRDRMNVTYLYISHDMDTVAYLCESVSVMFRGRIVERGPTEDVLDDPRHPYTRALVSSRLSTVPGERSSFVELGPHVEDDFAPGICSLVGSCPVEVPRCRRDPIELRRIGKQREVACWVEGVEGKDAAEPF